MLQDTIISILSKNYNKESYKKDKRIRASAIRTIHTLTAYGLLHSDKRGRVLGIDDIEALSNYALLEIVEHAIISLRDRLIDNSILATLESIDYLGKCWYSGKEIADALERLTLQKHNKNRMRRMLDNLVKHGICIMTMDNRYNKRYRIAFTK